MPKPCPAIITATFSFSLKSSLEVYIGRSIRLKQVLEERSKTIRVSVSHASQLQLKLYTLLCSRIVVTRAAQLHAVNGKNSNIPIISL